MLCVSVCVCMIWLLMQTNTDRKMRNVRVRKKVALPPSLSAPLKIRVRSFCGENAYLGYYIYWQNNWLSAATISCFLSIYAKIIKKKKQTNFLNLILLFDIFRVWLAKEYIFS